MNLYIINGIATILVGAIALLVYLLGKHNDKKSAATIIVMDIRAAELVVISILEKGVVDHSYLLNPVRGQTSRVGC